MKLYLNDLQRNLVLEILRASEKNAVEGKDTELAEAFNQIYKKIEPTNCAYVSINRGDAETLVEFCEIISKSLDNARKFLDSDQDKSEEEKELLKKEVLSNKNEIDEILDFLYKKIKENPV